MHDFPNEVELLELNRTMTIKIGNWKPPQRPQWVKEVMKTKGTNMKILLTLAFMLLSSAASAGALTICDGQFALCAASACVPTGGTITNSAGKSFPEVLCTCPILKGKNIADLSGGNMKGSCAPTDADHVWSTFWPRFDYPR